MKKLFLILAVSAAAILSCAMYFGNQVTDLFAQLTLSQKTETNEILSGCVGYYQAHKRWPKTEAEIRNGLKQAHLEPKHLNQVKNLKINAKAGILDITFSTKSGVPVTIHSEIESESKTEGRTKTKGSWSASR